MVGNVDAMGRKLVEAAKACLDYGVMVCGPGVPFQRIGMSMALQIVIHINMHFTYCSSNLGQTIQDVAEEKGFTVVPCETFIWNLFIVDNIFSSLRKVTICTLFVLFRLYWPWNRPSDSQCSRLLNRQPLKFYRKLYLNNKAFNLLFVAFHLTFIIQILIF